MAGLSDDERYDLDSADEDGDEYDSLGYGYGQRGGDGGGAGASSANMPQFGSQAEKRAHHNALERKRRDHIKDSFCSLRDTIPTLQGEKSSRAQILKKAADYIQFMRKKNSAHLQDIEDLRQQNFQLGSQIRTLDVSLQQPVGAGAAGPGHQGAPSAAYYADEVNDRLSVSDDDEEDDEDDDDDDEEELSVSSRMHAAAGNRAAAVRPVGVVAQVKRTRR